MLESKYLEFVRVKFAACAKSKKFICIVGSMENLEKLKKDKRSLKSSLTKYLNKLALELLLESPKNERIVDRLNDIEKRRDELLELLENLQALYKESKESKETANVASIEEEANGIMDRVDNETKGARLFLAKGVAKSSEGNSNAQLLRLESCLEGEAAATVKGLGYSSVAYEAAKTRLNRKYRGNRQQVRAHIDELRKMNPLIQRTLESWKNLLT